MKPAALALAGCLALFALPALAQESDGVPFIGDARENYQIAFSTALRLLDTQGPEAVEAEVAQCYANIESDERIRRTQYCFLYDAASVVTRDLLQGALAGRTDGKVDSEKLDLAARKAVGSLMQAGFDDGNAKRFAIAWLMTGKTGITSAQSREFWQVVQRHGGVPKATGR